MHPLTAIFALTLSCALGATQPKTLTEWSFAKNSAGWGLPCHLGDVRTENGALQGRLTNSDPSLRSPQFEIPATPWQRIEVRLKTDCDGQGRFCWTGTTAGSSDAFPPDHSTPFRVVGDGEWHDYQVFPFWHAEKRIVLLRLNLPAPTAEEYGKKTFALRWIRIVDIGAPPDAAPRSEWDFTRGLLGWSPFDSGTTAATPPGLRFANGPFAGSLVSGPLRCSLRDRAWASLEMAVDKGAWGQVMWVASDVSGMQSVRFPLRPDGKFHRYDLDVSAQPAWRGDALLLGLSPSEEPGATATIRSLSLATSAQGPPETDRTEPGAGNPNN